MVQDTPSILKIAINFYKDLFKKEDRTSVSLRSDFWDPEDLVTGVENAELEAPFCEEEVRAAVFSCYSEGGGTGPDGLSFLFYHKFWDVIKMDILHMFDDFFKGQLDLFRLNFAMLTLIPKVEEASEMKNFRPISLLNCSFKIFSKVLTIRLEKVCQRLIAKEQSAFIRCRYILESVVIAHEVLHSIHKSKTLGVVLKLDYEKAYDRVNLDFLFESLKLRGFGNRILDWIMKVVLGGSVSVLANGEESETFKIGKGLRQEDPLSPLLFNLVADVLTKILEKAARNRLVSGLLEQFSPGGILALQYADDTLIFSSCDSREVRNLKGVLMLFEKSVRNENKLS
jgi:hypothetical protein